MDEINKELRQRVRILIILRAVFTTSFLGAAIIFHQRTGLFSSIPSFLSLIVLIYGLSIIYFIYLNFVKRMLIFCYFQIFVDIVLETAIIYFTGGIQSNFSFLYIISIMTSNIILYGKGGWFFASLSSIFYGLLINFQFYRLIPFTFFFESPQYSQASFIFYKLALNIFAFYTVAFLSQFLAKELLQRSKELQEKKSDLISLKNFHENLVKNMRTGLLTVDFRGLIKSFNPAAEIITGYQFEEVNNNSFYTLFPAFNLNRIIRENRELDKNNYYHCEGVFRKKNKDKIYLGMTISLLKEEESVLGIICSFQDITETKKIQQKIVQVEKLATIGQFASNLAHEIRNPLASISGSLELLKEEFLQENKYFSTLMEIILSEIERLNLILSRFLDYSHPRPALREYCNLNELLLDNIELIKKSKEFKPKTKITFLPGADNIRIKIDPEQIKQVIWNIFLNALQAMEGRGELIISTFLKNNSVEINFKDSGCGLDQETLEKVFTPFYTTKEGGTGLGLSVVARIIEEHKGKIKLSSELGSGTEVKITLPRK